MKWAQSWLDVQCTVIPGVRRAALVQRDSSSDEPKATALWPKTLDNLPEEFSSGAARAWEKGATVVRARSQEGGNTHSVIAAPTSIGNDAASVAVFEVEGDGTSQQQVILQLIVWGSQWLNLIEDVHRHGSDAEGLTTVVELLAGALEQERYGSAVTRLVTESAARLGCERVSLGLLKRRRIEIQAVSHNAHVDHRSNLLRQLSTAMEEAIDQDVTAAYPPVDGQDPLITFAQEVLARAPNPMAVCSTPLYDAGKPIGALTFERSSDRPFDQTTVELCESLGALFGPVIALKHARDRPAPVVVWDALKGYGGRLFGPKHFTLKAWTVGVLTLGIILGSVSGEYRVRAPATLEPKRMRVVAAPQSGFIRSADVRAGDHVTAGQLMASLKDDELKLERMKLQSEYQRYVKEQRAALGAGDRSGSAIANARMDQAHAQLKLVEDRLRRTQIVAPYDAIVVSGDISQSLGAPVSDGDVLFEIAPLDGYRIRLEVDERDISEIAQGQSGLLALTGLPSAAAIPFVVQRILPISDPRDGNNTFPVEAELTSAVEIARPGMQGVAKVHIRSRKLVWIWTHSLFDWIRVQLWAWTG
ncbi:MAG: HlyD family efflux transporter periplasmic adaptor subunit [Gammaproteobacteria bacterium]|nr:HlyD family efflux transporter periplasmic adaptor subunit [Gammaproteobacteria bacterium]